MSMDRLRASPRPHRVTTQTSRVVVAQPTARWGGAVEPKLLGGSKKLNEKSSKNLGGSRTILWPKPRHRFDASRNQAKLLN